MATIPAGYQLTITARDGEVIADIDLEGYDLSKSIARADVMNDIEEFINDDIELNKAK